MIRICLSVFAFLLAFSSWGQHLLVQPYLQPGNVSTLRKEGKVLIWQTDSIPGKYKVEFGLGPLEQSVTTAKLSFVTLHLNNKTTLLYRAVLTGLKFDSEYSYRVSLNGKPIAEGLFATRTKKPQTKFAVFGDCGAGTPQQAEIANQVYQQKPQFVLVTGDIVYNDGLEREYRNRFFPYYNATEANPKQGASLMNSIPFYMLLGNHDVDGFELDKTQDGLAYFYYNDLPLNGPLTEFSVKAAGQADRINKFKANTESRYPRMSNFSFDYGNVHIACLDSNPYANPLDPALLVWLSDDLKKSTADWKIVSYHHPGFNSSKDHYDDQIMRLLAPVLEQLGVDIVLSGHEHNYQRTYPLKFDPKKNETGTRYIISDKGRVDGKFTLDMKYDGVINTKPTGILYIVTGAGGGPLYGQALSGSPELWKHDPPENWIPFTVKLVSDIHSFSLIETNGKKLVLKQIDGKGNTFDQITITK